MLNIHIDLIGIVAGMCTTIAFLPQIMQILKSKHARDISFLMYAVFTTGVFLWLVYGILLKRIPIILANGVTLAFCLIVIAIKIKYDYIDKR